MPDISNEVNAGNISVSNETLEDIQDKLKLSIAKCELIVDKAISLKIRRGFVFQDFLEKIRARWV